MSIPVYKKQRRLLNIAEIKTIKDLNLTDFSKYKSDIHPSWIKYINNPISSEDLDNICKLSEHPKSKIEMSWSMGELFYRKKEKNN